MPYMFNNALFKAEGAFLDWAVIARKNKDRYAGNSRYTLQLRWMLSSKLGMPTEPFTVWRRFRGLQHPSTQVDFRTETTIWLFNHTIVTWNEGPMVELSVDVTAPANGGTVYAYSGSPVMSCAVAIHEVAAGNSTIILKGSHIDGLVASEGLQITAIQGIAQEKLNGEDAGWKPYELVGLPVPQHEWNGIGNHAIDQGMIGALVPPQDAALQRLERGAPQVGWAKTLPTGEPAPVWSLPKFPELVLKEIRRDVLDSMKPVLQNPPDRQNGILMDVHLPPPQNSSGKQMSGAGKTTKVAPLPALLIAGGSDPCLALALGFGTAYPAEPSGSVRDRLDPGNSLHYDYMITARWEMGLDGQSAVPYEIAALVPSPDYPLDPPVPANLKTDLMGFLRPLASDNDWRSSVKVSWDRPADMELFRPRTFAFVRKSLVPDEPVIPLMNERMSGGYRHPIINYAVADPPPPDWMQVAGVDREWQIPSATGSRSLRHGICQQDIWGQWSGWGTVDSSVMQPEVDDVRIVTAALQAHYVDAADPICKNSSLTIEFLWDWRIRRPEKIVFAGRLYAAAHHGDPPPDWSVPLGLQRTIGGADGPLDIHFIGDAPSAAGAAIVGLSEDGEQIVGFGPQQGDGARRYRLVLSNFDLNFSLGGHIGLALWAMGQERIAPKRLGSWSKDPSIITVSDPRPPIVEIPVVTLASLPDAAGECHARLSWTAASGNAAGYYIYESTETKLLVANGRSEPDQAATLSDRLAEIQQLFDANPSRQEFTRRNDRPIMATSTDVTLPKGSTAIHLFVIIAVNAGQVESEWPSGAEPHKQLTAIAAPRIMKPAPPMLEVQPVLDDNVDPPVYRAEIKVISRPGPRVRKVELFRVRVDDAARELGTMGPAIASIADTGGGWTVTKEEDSPNIENVTGKDSPAGSWKRVWYRAAAWCDADPQRGYLQGRSLASEAAWIVVPPQNPPDLSAVSSAWSGEGASGDVILKWTSSAPIHKTPLGHHTLQVQANVRKGASLIDIMSPLAALPDSKPLAGSGVWADQASPNPYAYFALIRRPSETDAVDVRIQMTDPLGRMSERLVQIAPGSILPPPLITGLKVTKRILPPGIVLEWKSNAPTDDTGFGPYMLSLTAIPATLLRPIKVTKRLSDIPTGRPGLIIGRGTSMQLFRNGNTYTAFCSVPVKQFSVVLTSPDGRTDQKTIEVR
ncbi:hypothetical protein [Paenibacillus montanisoli]|uniref:Uncharacterized protein n=1 Tax=Paenibacillus montanisoli TaxID=2081970 RepID=A0A328UCG8_9BACL|nr:hypothetical protein [Paenibacillus montanisoli]RAP77726.1 hypothetical protein DL346_04490 [Paenibacillus montanisoli]